MIDYRSLFAQCLVLSGPGTNILGHSYRSLRNAQKALSRARVCLHKDMSAISFPLSIRCGVPSAPTNPYQTFRAPLHSLSPPPLWKLFTLRFMSLVYFHLKSLKCTSLPASPRSLHRLPVTPVTFQIKSFKW